MYRHLHSIAAFVAVAETGAFNKAAEKLGVSASVVSHHVSKLEEFLDVTLVYRTTRKLALSDHGQTLFEVAKRGIGTIEETVVRIQDQNEKIVGSLRVALPAYVPDPRIERAIMDFATLHPNLALSLDYSDESHDLLEAGFDLSIWLSEPADTSFMRQKLADIVHILVASPTFLQRHGHPNGPADLLRLPFVSMQGLPGQITLGNGREESHIEPASSQIEVQSIHGAKAAAMAGLGIGNLPESLCSHELMDGSLVRLLPNWRLPPLTMQAIWPEQSRRSSLTRRLVGHLLSARKQHAR